MNRRRGSNESAKVNGFLMRHSGFVGQHSMVTDLLPAFRAMGWASAIERSHAFALTIASHGDLSE